MQLAMMRPSVQYRLWERRFSVFGADAVFCATGFAGCVTVCSALISALGCSVFGSTSAGRSTYFGVSSAFGVSTPGSLPLPASGSRPSAPTYLRPWLARQQAYRSPTRQASIRRLRGRGCQNHRRDQKEFAHCCVSHWLHGKLSRAQASLCATSHTPAFEKILIGPASLRGRFLGLDFRGYRGPP